MSEQLFTKQDMERAFEHGKYDMRKADFLIWLVKKEEERRRTA